MSNKEREKKKPWEEEGVIYMFGSSAVIKQFSRGFVCVYDEC